MGRFEKLNDDIQELADKILADQDLCKLIHYPENNPLEQPNINGKKHILDKRLLLFTPKIPLAADVGTYLSIRPTILRPSKGGNLIVGTLRFDIYSHFDARRIYYIDGDGNEKVGDRVALIMNKIEQLMDEVKFSIGKVMLDGIGEIMNTNAIFSGYTMGYTDIDFRN